MEFFRRKRFGRFFALLFTAALLLGTIPCHAFAEEAKWGQVSAGWYHSLGVKTDGTLWSWGANSYGQLGTGDKDSFLLPQKILENVAMAEAGESHSLALLKTASFTAGAQTTCTSLGRKARKSFPRSS